MKRGKITKLEMNKAGILAVLKDPGVAADLASRGESIAAALPTDKGQEWAVNNYVGRDRVATVVKTANYEAMRDAAENNSMQHALSAGGG